MMVSFAHESEWRCSGCTTSVLVVTWLTVDAVERPDLRVALASGSGVWMSCPSCGAIVEREDPLVVTRLAQVAPVLLALPDALLAVDDPAVMVRPLLDRVRASLGAVLRDVPGPILVVPFDVLVLAAGRDVDVDAAGSEGALHDLAAFPLEARERYAVFLDDVRGAGRQRRLGMALNRLIGVSSVEELERLAMEYPEVASSQAREELARRIEEAGDEEERDVAAARLRLAEAVAAGHLQEGWTAHQEAFSDIWTRHVAPRIERLLEELERHESAGDLAAAVEAGTELIAITDLPPARRTRVKLQVGSR